MRKSIFPCIWDVILSLIGCGTAAAGKSILASTTIEHLSSSDPTAVLTCVYCRYDEECTALDLLCSMIRQIIENHPNTVYAAAKPTYEDHRLKKSSLTMETAISLYASLLALFSTRIAVVDGLDEISNTEKTVLLGALKSLPLQLLIFSRPLPLFKGTLPSVEFLRIEARNEDIEQLVISKIQSDPELCDMVSANQGIVEEIASKVQASSNGM